MKLRAESVSRRFAGSSPRRIRCALVVAALLIAVVLPVSPGHAAGPVERGEMQSVARVYPDEYYHIPRAKDIHVFGFFKDGAMMVPVRIVGEAYG
ncbi:MAG: hypothetical protein AB1700_18335, partial [Bacillota bacterium]